MCVCCAACNKRQLERWGVEIIWIPRAEDLECVLDLDLEGFFFLAIDAIGLMKHL